MNIIERFIRCPISLDIMEKPMLCSDGHTYENKYINRWLRFRNKSPMTNSKIFNMVENKKISTLIKFYHAYEQSSLNKLMILKIHNFLSFEFKKKYIDVNNVTIFDYFYFVINGFDNENDFLINSIVEYVHNELLKPEMINHYLILVYVFKTKLLYKWLTCCSDKMMCRVIDKDVYNIYYDSLTIPIIVMYYSSMKVFEYMLRIDKYNTNIDYKKHYINIDNVLLMKKLKVIDIDDFELFEIIIENSTDDEMMQYLNIITLSNTIIEKMVLYSKNGNIVKYIITNNIIPMTENLIINILEKHNKYIKYIDVNDDLFLKMYDKLNKNIFIELLLKTNDTNYIINHILNKNNIKQLKYIVEIHNTWITDYNYDNYKLFYAVMRYGELTNEIITHYEEYIKNDDKLFKTIIHYKIDCVYEKLFEIMIIERVTQDDFVTLLRNKQYNSAKYLMHNYDIELNYNFDNVLKNISNEVLYEIIIKYPNNIHIKNYFFTIKRINE